MSLFTDSSTWLFRIEYIVTYYTYLSLKDLKNHCDNNDDISLEKSKIEEILEFGKPLFQSKFRNCMMHYNLVGYDVLSQEHIDCPFYGMVETCFGGKTYQSYLNELRSLSDMIVDYLESFLADTAESPNDNSYKETESFIKEQLNTAKLMSIYEMRIIENIISRLNDKYGHRFQLLLDEFRYYIDQQIENQSRPTQINTQGGPAIMGGEFNDPQFISHKQIESK
jgi:hypothetical protein